MEIVLYLDLNWVFTKSIRDEILIGFALAYFIDLRFRKYVIFD